MSFHNPYHFVPVKNNGRRDDLSKQDFINENVETVASPAIGGLIIGYEAAKSLNVRFVWTERENGAMTLRRGLRKPMRGSTISKLVCGRSKRGNPGLPRTASGPPGYSGSLLFGKKSPVGFSSPVPAAAIVMGLFCTMPLYPSPGAATMAICLLIKSSFAATVFLSAKSSAIIFKFLYFGSIHFSH